MNSNACEDELKCSTCRLNPSRLLQFNPVRDRDSSIGELKQQGFYLLMAGVHDASFWHSPPQLAMDRDQLLRSGNDHRLATFICEIPAG